MGLADAFLAGMSASELSATPSLEATLTRLLSEVKDVLPGSELNEQQFLEYVGERIDDVNELEAALGRINLRELRVAFSLAATDAVALRFFESNYVPGMRAVVGRISPNHVDDVLQGLREKLLVGSDVRGPRIRDYAGQGSLGVWLRVVAVRSAIDLARKEQREIPDDEILWQQVSPEIDPGRRVVRRQAISVIKAAFHDALGQLTARQRLLLRQHLIDELTIDEMAPMYQVHRATVARWLSAARQQLWREVRAVMTRDLEITEAELDSLIRQVRSSLDLSIERALL